MRITERRLRKRKNLALKEIRNRIPTISKITLNIQTVHPMCMIIFISDSIFIQNQKVSKYQILVRHPQSNKMHEITNCRK